MFLVSVNVYEYSEPTIIIEQLRYDYRQTLSVKFHYLKTEVHVPVCNFVPHDLLIALVWTLQMSV